MIAFPIVRKRDSPTSAPETQRAALQPTPAKANPETQRVVLQPTLAKPKAVASGAPGTQRAPAHIREAEGRCFQS
ncbi:hypothetical protein T484DRAFT_1946891 [Baffinella frigidus]|nr:hypothetical protein T484DRAFT_1946891 [Cryptophyta sp. CCMP2293]